MSQSPSIVPYAPEHREGLVRLWSRYFGAWSAERLLRRWSWQFEANPFVSERPPKILVALAGPRVVGHVSGTPLPLRVDGRRQVALCASGLVVEESERWLGFRLVRALLEEPPVLATGMSDEAATLFTKCGAAVVPGTTQQFVLPRSYAGDLTNRIRSRLPRVLANAVRVPAVRCASPWYVPDGAPRPRPLPRLQGAADVRPIDRFGPECDALWEHVRPRFAWSLEKSASYLQWRYVECPTARPVRLALFESGAIAAVAVGVVWSGIDRHRRPSVRFGEVTEFLAREPESPGARFLLASLVHRLGRGGVDSVVSLPLSAGCRPLFEAMGFELRSRGGHPAAVRWSGPPEPNAGAPGTREGYWTGGDGDALWSSAL